MAPMMPSCRSAAVLLIILLRYVKGFSVPANDKNSDASFTLFDRFRAVCPADPASVMRFHPSLIPSIDDNDDMDASPGIWVAVYRYSNNKPSVLIRDEFLRAMRSATDSRSLLETSAPRPMSSSSIETRTSLGVEQPAPVAVARLAPSDDHPGLWVMDCMRCALRKEDTDPACDGNSEHNEAIATAIDTLLEHYLGFCDRFDSAIRTKATLFSAGLLEERGFEPVTTLQRDMASHVSSLDKCLERYAARSVSTISKSPGARQRALNIVSLLGQLNREKDWQASMEEKANQARNDSDEYDPYAGSMIR
jgi:hypothetical protein